MADRIKAQSVCTDVHIFVFTCLLRQNKLVGLLCPMEGLQLLIINYILICSVQAVPGPTRAAMQWAIRIISSGVKRSEPEDENSPLI